MKTAKKAQLSWFVVLGMIFLIIILILSWLVYNTQFLKQKPGQLTVAEEELKNVKSYLESCEKELIEEALMLVGNQGGKIVTENYFEIGENKIETELQSLEAIQKDLESYINKNLARKCDPTTATEKEVTTSRIQTKISFNDKETITDITWPVTIQFENNTEKSIETIKTLTPVRMKLVYEAAQKDLEITGTDLNFIETLDNMDMKKISYENAVVNIIVDHKSKIKDKPYKFFYVAKI